MIVRSGFSSVFGEAAADRVDEHIAEHIAVYASSTQVPGGTTSSGTPLPLATPGSTS